MTRYDDRNRARVDEELLHLVAVGQRDGEADDAVAVRDDGVLDARRRARREGG